MSRSTMVFRAAQRVLVMRIRRDANPDEKLKDAVANFNDARDLLIEASLARAMRPCAFVLQIFARFAPRPRCEVR